MDETRNQNLSKKARRYQKAEILLLRRMFHLFFGAEQLNGFQLVHEQHSQEERKPQAQVYVENVAANCVGHRHVAIPISGHNH